MEEEEEGEDEEEEEGEEEGEEEKEEAGHGYKKQQKMTTHVMPVENITKNKMNEHERISQTTHQFFRPLSSRSPLPLPLFIAKRQ